MTKKSILIDEKSHKDLSKLSESLGLNYGTLVQEMIYYFKKTGIDPKDAENKNPSLMVAALDKRIVSFLKVQERDILKPLRQDVFDYRNMQKAEIDRLTSLIKQHLDIQSDIVKEIKTNYIENMKRIDKTDADRTNSINSELEKNQKAMLWLCQLLDDKNKSGVIDKIKTLFI